MAAVQEWELQPPHYTAASDRPRCVGVCVDGARAAPLLVARQGFGRLEGPTAASQVRRSGEGGCGGGCGAWGSVSACAWFLPSGDALSCMRWYELKAPWVVRTQAYFPLSFKSVFGTRSAMWRFWLVLLLVCHAPIDVHSVTVEQHSDYQTCLAYTSSCTSMCAALPPAPGRFLATARKKRTSEY